MEINEEYMKKLFKENDYFGNYCGISLVKCENGFAEMHVTLDEHHMSKIGRLHAHAGLLYTISESASAAAILSYGYDAMASDGKITYLGAVTKGKLKVIAKAKDLHESEYGSCKVTVYNEEELPIAKCVFTIYYTGEKFLLSE